MRSLVGTILNKTPIPYISARASNSLGMFAPHRNDAESQMRALGSVGTLFAIVTRLAQSTAQVDWHLYRKAANGNEDERTEVTRHAALDIWNTPNPFFPQNQFIEVFQQHLDLTGEAWWVVARNPMMPIPLELWPVRPDRMTPIPSATDFLAGYIYTGPDGEQVPLQLDEVIQLKMPNPLDPYRGMGPVQAILTDLDSNRYSAEWNRNFFLNGAQPGGIIQVEKRLSDVEFEEATMRWREQHQGVSNAHRVAIIEQGVWVDTKFSQQDMQFAQIRDLTRDVIREAFAMPKSELGVVEDVNRANADTGSAIYARRQDVPRLERIKQALNFNLLPMFGNTSKGLEFDYDNPVPEDVALASTEMVAKAQAAQIYINAGFEPADVLDQLGIPDMALAPPKPVPALLAPGVPPGQAPAVPPAEPGVPEAGGP